MNARQRSRLAFDLLFLGMLVLAALFVVYQGVAMVSTLVKAPEADASVSVPGAGGGGDEGVGQVIPDSAQGLRFRLSEAAPREVEIPELPPAEPLSPAGVERVLARVPPLPDDDVREFALPAAVVPPPRTGVTVRAEFPPAEEREAPEGPAAGPLEIVRWGPEGAVERARAVSITFSQPMVPVTAHAELAARDVPARLRPQPRDGRWRWLGTRTLVFEVDAGLPMATAYRVEVPAGVAAASGARLARAKRWRFKTPTVQLVRSYPRGDSNPTDPLIFAAFNQRIDADAVLEHISVRAGRQSDVVRRATAEEIAADDEVARLTKLVPDGYWVAFRTARSLPREAAVQVVIKAGTPSAEGPLTTESDQSFSFRTYGPLRVVRTRCGWGDECLPRAPWQVEFNNPLDGDAFDDSLVAVEPELPGLRVAVRGERLSIQGRSEPRRRYRVTLAAAVRDIFAGTLGRDEVVTFEVDSVPATLTARGDELVTLDPLGPREFTVRSINHRALKVRLHRVGPEHWPGFAENHDRYRYDERPWQPPGRLVHSQVVEVDAEPDTWAETRIDLTPALRDGLGHAVLVVEPEEQPEDERRHQAVVRWIQATRIGLTALADAREVIGWATSLEDASPVAGAELRIVPDGGTAVTDGEGLASIPFAGGGSRYRALVARRDADEALLPLDRWRVPAQNDRLGWYVFTDRPLYRPGVRVHAKGWLRRIGGGETGDVAMPGGRITTVDYTVRDSRGNDVAKGTAELNDRAGFDFAFGLPEDVALGRARLEVVARGVSGVVDREHRHGFQVEEFRRPEYEVSADHDAGPHIIGGHAVLTATAKYFAGGGLPDSEVRWRVQARPAFFRPANRDDFTFGRPWVYTAEPSGVQEYAARTDLSGRHRLRVDLLEADPPVAMSLAASAAVQDVNRQTWTASTQLIVHPGALAVGLKSARRFVRAGEPLVVEVIVVDLDGAAVPGRRVELQAARVEWKYQDGAWRAATRDPQECRVTSEAEPVRCEFETRAGGSYRIRGTVTDDQERASLTQLTLWAAGGYGGRARRGAIELVADRETYAPGDVAEILVQAAFTPAEGVMTLRRAGIIEAQRFRMDEPSHVLRVPIREAYIPNLHVEVELVAAAPEDASRHRLPDPDRYASDRLNLAIPPRARTLALSAEPRESELRPGGETVVEIELRDAAGRPVADGDVAVAVVDEAVLALWPEELRDPVDAFHPGRGPGARDYHLRASVLLGPRPDSAAGTGSLEGAVFDAESGAGLAGAVVSLEGTERRALTGANGGFTLANLPAGRYTAVAEYLGYGSSEERLEIEAGAAREVNFVLNPQPFMLQAARFRAEVAGVELEEAALAPATVPGEAPGIRLRADFAALAAFVASARTDARGQVEVPVRVPDNLTRYRVIAVAAAGAKQFGKGESTLTVGLPLMARPSPPRFLNYGDQLELPVVIQNRADTTVRTAVAVRATNLEWTAGQGRRVEVPGHGRVEVRFPATTHGAGTARVQVAAVAGAEADAALIELPVWTPATTEAFATYGELDEGAAAIPVAAPGDVVHEFGGLEVTTSATALQALTDALLYLYRYRYECAEQLASRILAVAALRDVLAAFEAEGLPEPEVLVAAVARDIKRLQALQNMDGGFGFWRRDEKSWPYVSIHVAHALERARQKGFDVPVEMIERARGYLRRIDSRIPADYPADCRRALRAYALYVRDLMGDGDPAEARRVIAEAGLDGVPLEATGWLLVVLSGERGYGDDAAAIRRHLANRVSETAATAQFTSRYGAGAYLVLHSSRRTDAVILDALIADQPESDLITKLVRGLLAHRVRGRWRNTQENAFVLLALDRYFATYEQATPEFTARVWLGDDYAGGHQFAGRTTERYQIDIPMRWLSERAETADLLLGKEGPGRLYYRVGLRYAPADLTLEPAEHGFAVERVYEPVDEPDDVKRRDDGSWIIRAGARVRVKLSMAAPGRRYHVALVDPLPAGLESLNPVLAGSETRNPRQASRQGWYGPHGWRWWYRWYEHENLRDERVEVFTSLLYGGVYDYSYLARATTPGTFVVPPAKAEEMYQPETFGRGGSDRVIVR